MLKELFSQRLNTQLKTVQNAIITLGDTDDSGKGRKFKSRFIQPGIAGYPGQFGTALIRKESFDKFIYSLRGKSVIINHKDVITEEDKVGEVHDVWFNPDDGWYWCNGLIWDETAQNLITDKGWSVSCSYDVKLADDAGGTENNIPYDIEFLDGVFTHLAIVDNPRYERANIVFNSKTVVQNFDPTQPRVPKGNPNGGQFTKNTVDLTNYFTSTPTMKEVKEFLNKMVEEGKEFATSSPDWFVDIPSSSRKKDHIAKSSQFQRMNKSQKNRHNKYVMALEDLLGNAQYLNPSPNKKPLEKPNTQQYHYFKSEAKIGTKTYKILFDTEEYKGDSTIKPQTVHLYDVREVKNSSLSANVQPSVKNLKEESNNIITDIQEDFNPDIKNNVQNNKENTEMALIDELKKLITKVENDKGEDMDDKEKVENEKVDKRKLIDEVAGIMKSAGADDEKIRTAIAKMEKLAYDESEAGTADNKKAKNEKEDEPKDDKPADNSKVKNESEEDNKKYDDLKKETKEDVENKCKNSVDNSKGGYFDKMNEIYNSAIAPKEENTYISREQKLKDAESYFAK